MKTALKETAIFTITVISAIVLSLSLFSCSSNILDEDYSVIDAELKPYVNQFVQEANKRGVTIETYNLKVVFDEIGGNTAGDTNHKITLIRIDSTKSNWKKSPKNTVWHELGHLYLHHDHDNSVLKNGDPKSIMNDGRNTPKFERVNTFKEEYYLNELFDSKTADPNW